MRRTSAYRGFARTIDSLACQALRATTCGAPTEAVRRSGTRETGLRTVSVRARATLPLVRTWTATALPTQTGALLRQAPRTSALEAAGVRALVLVLPRRPPRRPAGRQPTASAPRRGPGRASGRRRAGTGARRPSRSGCARRRGRPHAPGAWRDRRSPEAGRTSASALSRRKRRMGKRSVTHHGFSDKAAGPPLTQCLPQPVARNAGRARPARSSARPRIAHRVERVADLRAAPPGRHETGFAQDLQVLAHGRLTDLEELGEVAGAGLGLLCETQRDPEPDRVTERLEAFGVERDAAILRTLS